MTRLRTARFVAEYAEMLRHWAGGDDDIVSLAAPPSSILRDAAIDCARTAESMAQQLKAPAAQRRRRPTRHAARQFAQAHDVFGRELRLAVRLAARAASSR